VIVRIKNILGIVLIVVGAVLAAFFWSARFMWFQGGPIGLLFIGLGGFELWESRRPASRARPRGLLAEPHEGVGARNAGDSDQHRTP